MDARAAQQPVPSPLMKLSNPPTKSELKAFEDVPKRDLPETYYRPPHDRIYVNRDLRMDKIKFIGFDMDFTLAVYKESHDRLTFDLALKELVRLGYPEEVTEKLQYDDSYPIRGLMLDISRANYLKVDMFGHISKCYHGSKQIPKKQLAGIYPSLMVNTNDRAALYSLDTLYSVCEAALFRQMVDFLEDAALDVSWENLFQDVRSTMDRIHRNGMLKAPIMAEPEKYIHKAPQLRPLLERMRERGCKVFLLTNSDYLYSNVVMSYLLPKEEVPEWKQCFDYIIVAACKPAFFHEGSQLREVDQETGNLHIGRQPKELLQGKVYNGGSIDQFQKLTGAVGNQVLYVGDHIFSDVVVSKQRHFWRTLLVVRELEREIAVDLSAKELKLHLANLEFIRREAHRGLDASASTSPDTKMKELRKEIAATQKKLDNLFNAYWGSLFRSGTKHSLFSLQVRRFADLYTSHFGNLSNYPLFYLFTSTSESLPHEDVPERPESEAEVKP